MLRGASTTQKHTTTFVSRSSNKEEGKTHKGKIPPSNEGAYKTIAKAAKNGMTRQSFVMTFEASAGFATLALAQ